MVSITTLLATISSISMMANFKPVSAAIIDDKLLKRAETTALEPFNITTSESESSTTTKYTSTISSSTTPTPTSQIVSVSGAIVEGYPKWVIVIPGDLGPLEVIDLQLATSWGPFVYTDASITVEGAELPAHVDGVLSTNLTVSHSGFIMDYPYITITVEGKFYERGDATAEGTLFLTVPGERLTKRDVLSFPISFEIASNENTNFGPVYPSSSSSSSSETATDSTTSTTTHHGPTNNGTTTHGPSTATTKETDTTSLTITSCSEDKCHKSVVPTTLTSATNPGSTTATVSTFQGSGSRLVVGSSFAAFIIGMMFF